MALKQNVAGTWKDITCWINVAGTWKQATVWKNVAGTWKQITGSSLSASLPASIWAQDFTFYPNPAYAVISIQSSGAWIATNEVGGTWMNSGTGADYEVRLTGTGTTPGGAALNTWLQLNTTRYWDLATSGGGYESYSFSGTLEIRPYGGGTVLASSSITIDATTEI